MKEWRGKSLNLRLGLSAAIEDLRGIRGCKRRRCEVRN
jgi:hypothetical protein